MGITEKAEKEIERLRGELDDLETERDSIEDRIDRIEDEIREVEENAETFDEVLAELKETKRRLAVAEGQAEAWRIEALRKPPPTSGHTASPDSEEVTLEDFGK